MRGVARLLADAADSSPSTPARTSGSSGPLRDGMLKFGVRWNTVRCAACAAITGMAWMADEPVPMIADPLAGEIHAFMRPVPGVVGLAREASASPGKSGIRALERQPVAMMQISRRHAVAAVGRDRPAMRRLVEARVASRACRS